MELDLKSEAQRIDGQTQAAVERLSASGVRPYLVDIVASDDSAVASYVGTKQKKASRLGLRYEVLKLGRDQSTDDVVALTQSLNNDVNTHGVMVSTPLYAHLDAEEIIESISPSKDIDGLTPFNAGLLALNEEHKALIPATALASIHILEKLGSMHSKDVVVVGRGKTIGRPVAQLILNRHATVTVCHSQTVDLAAHTKRCQILVVAVGKPAFIRPEMVSQGQIVVDCGINVIDGRVCGDVDSQVARLVAYLSPVPGGVGLLTNAFLFANLVKAALLQANK